MAELRSRSHISLNPTSLPQKIHTDDHNKAKTDCSSRFSSPYTLGGRHWLLVIAFNAAILLFLHGTNSNFPTPLSIKSAPDGRFVEERARRTLNGITGFGSRPVGSFENENLTVEYLLKEIEMVRSVAQPVHKVEVDVQLCSGSFTLNFLTGFTTVYDNMKNVLVKLSPAVIDVKVKSASLLVNCHYDTAINSTGASDDAVSCSMMLEVLRVLATRTKPLRHSIIFIFNGAEENILQASHGFITQHRWASDVRAFVNLEAAGAGGRELLFQAGPDNPWLVRMYAEHAPHPFASVMGQEIFDSGIISSDTDFRIYRDYGGLPGLDIAYISNGYVYHTPADRPDMIPAGCIQRGGDNLLAVVGAMADSSYLVEPGEYRHGKLVYFDFVGLFMIVYTEQLGVVINVACLLVVAIRIGRHLIAGRYGSTARSTFTGLCYLKHLGAALVVMLLSWILAILTVTGIATFLNTVERSMSWFTNVYLVFGLYAAPSILVILLVTSVVRRFTAVADARRIESVYFDATLLFFSAALGGMTIAGFNSAVLPLVCVFCPLVARIISEMLNGDGQVPSSDRLLVTHYAGLFIPAIFILYGSYAALLMFCPIMGRSGGMIKPDIFIGIAVAVTSIISLAYHVSLVFLTHPAAMRRFMAGTSVIFVVGLLLALFTPVGFPYSSDPSWPTRQRHILNHISRRVHDIDGHVTEQDSGILHFPFDHNGLRHVKDIVPGLAHATNLHCRQDLPYCGIPFYFPVIALIGKDYWTFSPAGPVDINPHPAAQLAVLDRKLLHDGKTIEISFTVTGPSHVNIYVMPTREDVEVVRWSVGGGGEPVLANMPPGTTLPHYFVFYSYGTKPDKPLELRVYVATGGKAEGKGMKGLLKVALGAHYLIAGNELTSYLLSMPDWTIPIGWTATYDSYVV